MSNSDWVIRFKGPSQTYVEEFYGYCVGMPILKQGKNNTSFQATGNEVRNTFHKDFRSSSSEVCKLNVTFVWKIMISSCPKLAHAIAYVSFWSDWIITIKIKASRGSLSWKIAVTSSSTTYETVPGSPSGKSKLLKPSQNLNRSGRYLNINMISYQYRNSHCGDKTILCLISTMRFPLLIRGHLYIDSDPWWP